MTVFLVTEDGVLINLAHVVRAWSEEATIGNRIFVKAELINDGVIALAICDTDSEAVEYLAQLAARADDPAVPPERIAHRAALRFGEPQVNREIR